MLTIRLIVDWVTFFVQLWLVLPTGKVLFGGRYFTVVLCLFIAPVLSTMPSTDAYFTSVLCTSVLWGNSPRAVGNVPFSFGRIKSPPNQTFLFQITEDSCPKGFCCEPNLSKEDYKSAQTTKDYINVHVALEPPQNWHKALLRLPASSLKKAKQGFGPTVWCSGNPWLHSLFWYCIN